MAKQYKGNLADLLETSLHHIAPHKVSLMGTHGVGTLIEGVTQQNRRVSAELTYALAQLAKIREAATAGNAQKVLELLDEEFPYGIEE